LSRGETRGDCAGDEDTKANQAKAHTVSLHEYEYAFLEADCRWRNSAPPFVRHRPDGLISADGNDLLDSFDSRTMRANNAQ
jgi:hypothetical protein